MKVNPQNFLDLFAISGDESPFHFGSLTKGAISSVAKSGHGAGHDNALDLLDLSPSSDQGSAGAAHHNDHADVGIDHSIFDASTSAELLKTKGHGGGGTSSTTTTTTTTTTTSTSTTTSGTTTTTTGETGGSDPVPSYVAPALESGYSWGHGPITVKYTFLTALPSYYSSTSQEASNFSAFTQTQQNAVHSILDGLSKFINVSFVETTVDQAQITFGDTTLPSGVAAWTYYPYSSGVNSQAGDLWVNSTYSFNATPSPGNFGYMVLEHELGHAMGLKHPEDGTYHLPTAEDTRQYTMMTYNADPNMPGVEPQSYMTYDIATLQTLYGANTTTATGNDVYKFGAPNLLETIWDAGGTDTFDASAATQPATIDLTGGHFSSIDGVSNIGIAYGVTIENAIGSPGNDAIIGNAANNIINGGGGNDVMTGNGGADTFVFGPTASNDVITDFIHGTDLMDVRSLAITMADVHITDSTAGAVVAFSNDTVTLKGVAASTIDQHDFLFA